jgi:hypothetical protein
MCASGARAAGADPGNVTRFEVLSEVRDVSGLRARDRHALVARHPEWVTFLGVSVGVGAIMPVCGEPVLRPGAAASTRALP